MTAIAFTAANVSANEERGSVIDRYTTGEVIGLGMAVYLDGSNVAWKAKSDSSAHANAIGIAAIADNFSAETTIPTGGTVAVVVFGPVQGFTGLVSGEPVWVDSTAGQMNDTAPTGGAYQYVVGHAIDANTILVDPGTTSPVSHA